jgi:hypothetical protein
MGKPTFDLLYSSVIAGAILAVMLDYKGSDEGIEL